MAYSDNVLRVTFWDDEIDSIEEVDSVTFHKLASFNEYQIYPANLLLLQRNRHRKPSAKYPKILTNALNSLTKLATTLRHRELKSV